MMPLSSSKLSLRRKRNSNEKDTTPDEPSPKRSSSTHSHDEIQIVGDDQIQNNKNDEVENDNNKESQNNKNDEMKKIKTDGSKNENSLITPKNYRTRSRLNKTKNSSKQQPNDEQWRTCSPMDQDSPCMDSQIPSTQSQQCEVFWDCNSPGFSVDDLKKQYKINESHTPSPIALSKNAGLEAKRKQPLSSSPKTCSSAIVAQLDDLIAKVNQESLKNEEEEEEKNIISDPTESSNAVSDVQFSCDKNYISAPLKKNILETPSRSIRTSNDFNTPVGRTGTSAESSSDTESKSLRKSTRLRKKYPKALNKCFNNVTDAKNQVNDQEEKSSTAFSTPKNLIQNISPLDNLKKSDKSANCGFSDDDLFNESFLASTQAIEDALYNKETGKFESPSILHDLPKKLKLSHKKLPSPMSKIAPKKNIVISPLFDSNNGGSALDKHKISVIKHSDAATADELLIHKLIENSDVCKTHVESKGTKTKDPVKFEIVTENYKNDSSKIAASTLNVFSINNGRTKSTSTQLCNFNKRTPRTVAAQNRSKSETFKSEARIKRNLSSEFPREKAESLMVEMNDEDDKFFVSLMPALDEIEAEICNSRAAFSFLSNPIKKNSSTNHTKKETKGFSNNLSSIGDKSLSACQSNSFSNIQTKNSLNRDVNNSEKQSWQKNNTKAAPLNTQNIPIGIDVANSTSFIKNNSCQLIKASETSKSLRSAENGKNSTESCGNMSSGYFSSKCSISSDIEDKSVLTKNKTTWADLKAEVGNTVPVHSMSFDEDDDDIFMQDDVLNYLDFVESQYVENPKKNSNTESDQNTTSLLNNKITSFIEVPANIACSAAAPTFSENKAAQDLPPKSSFLNFPGNRPKESTTSPYSSQETSLRNIKESLKKVNETTNKLSNILNPNSLSNPCASSAAAENSKQNSLQKRPLHSDQNLACNSLNSKIGCVNKRTRSSFTLKQNCPKSNTADNFSENLKHAADNFSENLKHAADNFSENLKPPADNFSENSKQKSEFSHENVTSNTKLYFNSLKNK